MITDSKNPVKVGFYIRVSTDEQKKHGYGSEMQLNALNDMMEYKGKHYNWVNKPEWIFIDQGLSGSDLNRPELNKMMKLVNEGGLDIVAVWKIDRLSRSLTHLLNVFEKLKTHNCSFFSLKESIDFSGAIGKLTFQIFGALAEFERETIRLRTTEGKLASARMGNYISTSVPYGYKRIPNPKTSKGTTLEIIKKEGEWIKQIYQWFIFENKTYEWIARELTDLGVPKGMGGRLKNKSGKWFSQSVKDMLINPIYTGTAIEKSKHPETGESIITKMPVPAIINEKTYRQTLFKARQISDHQTTKGGGKNQYMLSRKIVDLNTGRYFVGICRTKGGFSYRRKSFVDSNGLSHKNKELPAHAIEDFVWSRIEMAICHPKDFFKLYTKSNIKKEKIEKKLAEQQLYKEHLEKVEQKICTLYDTFLEGKISEERKNKLESEYQKNIKETNSKLEILQEEIDQYTETEISLDALNKYTKDFKNDLNHITYEEKIPIVETFVDRVEVEEDDHQVKVTVYFKFAQPSNDKNTLGVEPVKGLKLSKKKQKPHDPSSLVGNLRPVTFTPLKPSYWYIPVFGQLEYTIVGGNSKKVVTEISR